MKSKPSPGPLYFAVYSVELLYGGPEEGGWWYDCGEVLAAFKLRRSEVRVVRVPVPAWRSTRGYAWETMIRPEVDRRLRRLAAREFGYGVKRNRGLGRHSVLGGADIEIRVTRSYPQPFPATTPRYE